MILGMCLVGDSSGHHVRAVAVLALALLLFVPRLSMAQEGTPCTWDNCALRMQGRHLVRGIEGEEVAKIGSFPPDISPFFEERSQKAVTEYQSFRAKQTSGSALLLVGVAAIIAGGFANHQGEHGLGLGLAIGGLVTELVGGLRIDSGRKDLSRAVWWYNRTLAVQ